MIFFLRKEGGDYSPGNVGIAALENLGAVGASGQHLVVGERDLLSAIASDDRLSPRVRSYYRRVEQSLTQFGALIRLAPKLTIDLSDESSVVLADLVPIGVFSSMDYCEKSQLLVENLTDFDVLTSLARVLGNERYKGLELSIRAQNGGGSTTAAVLEHLSRVPSGPVICVVDSDRTYEGGRAGSTLLTAYRIARRSQDAWRVQFYALEQRELENLVPHDLLSHCAPHVPAEEIKSLLGVSSAYVNFCCFKSGDSKCRMISSVISKGRIDLLKSMVSIESSGLPAHPACGTCPSPNGCFQSPAFGANFLQRVAEELLSGRGVTTMSRWKSDLIELVEKVFLAGAALAPQRV